MKIALLGTVGVPGRYGGFETLAENLVKHHARTGSASVLTVWCSSKDNATRPTSFQSANLRYVGLKANGVQSILYDVLGLLDAIRTGHNQILLLGVSGAMTLPLIRIFSRARIVTNIDGIEWKREKWNGLARAFLRASEWAAVRFSHEVIADNQAVAEHVRKIYGANCHVIAYGGDHALSHDSGGKTPEELPKGYALAICRIEPENNVHTILEAFSSLETPLVFVGNWGNSAYGQELKARYGAMSNLHILDPIYDPDTLYALRRRASIYVHGHSAGGTNPSLVEMMYFGVPVLAHGCNFNRYSTEDRALYFMNPDELVALVQNLPTEDANEIGNNMQEIARRRYTWDQIGEAYFALLEDRQQK